MWWSPLTTAGWFFEMKMRIRIESKSSLLGKEATSKEEGFLCHGVPRNSGRLRKAKQVKTPKRKDWSLHWRERSTEEAALSIREDFPQLSGCSLQVQHLPQCVPLCKCYGWRRQGSVQSTDAHWHANIKSFPVCICVTPIYHFHVDLMGR